MVTSTRLVSTILLTELTRECFSGVFVSEWQYSYRLTFILNDRSFIEDRNTFFLLCTNEIDNELLIPTRYVTNLLLSSDPPPSRRSVMVSPRKWWRFVLWWSPYISVRVRSFGSSETSRSFYWAARSWRLLQSHFSSCALLVLWVWFFTFGALTTNSDMRLVI